MEQCCSLVHHSKIVAEHFIARSSKSTSVQLFCHCDQTQQSSPPPASEAGVKATPADENVCGIVVEFILTPQLELWPGEGDSDFVIDKRC